MTVMWMWMLLVGFVQEGPPTSTPPLTREQPEPATPAEPPSCKGLFEQSAKAIEQVKWGSYEARRFGTGMVEDKVPRLKAAVAFEALRKDDPIGGKIDVRGGYGADGTSNPFRMVYDGTTFAIRFEKDQVVFQGDPRKDPELIKREELRLLLKDFFPGPIQYFQALNASTYRYEGRQEVEGVLCDVVWVEHEPESSRKLPPFHSQRKVFRSRWFLGVEDHLPRRAEWMALHIPDLTGPQAEAAAVLVLSDLKINGEQPAGLFTLPQADTPSLEPAPAPTQDPSAPAAKPQPESASAASTDVPPPNDGTARRDRKRDRLDPGEAAPDWELADFDGKKHKLSDFRGKVVLMDFWATWCKPCILAMPDLEKIHEAYVGKGVVLVGLNVEDDAAPARDFLRQTRTPYLQIAQAAGISKLYGLSALPAFVIIDAEGKLAFRASGWGPDRVGRIKEALDAALPQPANPGTAGAASPADQGHASP